MFVWRKSAVDISAALCFFTLFVLVLFTKFSFLVCFVALLLSLFSHERKKDYFFFIVSAWMANDNVIKGLTSDPILCLYFWQIFCGCTYMPSISECGRIGKWNEIKPKRNHETREKRVRKIHTAQFAFISSSHIFHISYPTVLWIVSCGVFPKKKMAFVGLSDIFFGRKKYFKRNRYYWIVCVCVCTYICWFKHIVFLFCYFFGKKIAKIQIKTKQESYTVVYTD